MGSSMSLARFDRYAAPLVVALIAVVAVLAVPPLVLGELTGRTYTLTAAVLVLALGSVLPYALLVGVGTLPLLAADVVSFAAPPTDADRAHQLSAESALRHVVAGGGYVLAATVVGAIGIGAQFGVGGSTSTPALLQQVAFYGGGLLVAAAFVPLHLWRYAARGLDRRTVLATGGLGVLLALAPVVAFWVFDGSV
ncbi:MAG: hypothetical protein ACOCPZ_03895 [Natrialbaceae archaeon]